MKYLLGILGIFFANVANAAPDIYCWALPWCNDSGPSEENAYSILGNIIALTIQYTAVIAVIAVMIWWILYLLSSGDEEKTKKAKNVIIWSLVGVFVSLSAYGIIEIINNFNF